MHQSTTPLFEIHSSIGIFSKRMEKKPNIVNRKHTRPKKKKNIHTQYKIILEISYGIGKQFRLHHTDAPSVRLPTI